MNPRDGHVADRGGVSAAVIAGGRSRRMGVDKRGLVVEGVPMLRRAIAAAASVADEVIVACRPDDPPDPALLEGLDVRLVHDRFADAGPLAGVEAALAEARHDLVVVLAVDLPRIEPAVLRLLVEAAGAHPDAAVVALETDRGPEPLLAVYRVDPARVAARQLLTSGVRRMHALLDELSLVVLPADAWHAADPSGRSAMNLNEPGDVEAASALANA